MGIRLIVVPAVLSFMLAACHVTGPTSIRTGRNDYNIAVQQTNNEQLLLNLVRLGYRDTTFFLETSSIVTSFSFEASGSASAALPSGSNTYGIGGGLVYTEKPTITYAPLQGDDFVRELLAPIDLQTLLLLSHTGWEIDRLLRVTVQEINGITNAPRRAGATDDAASDEAPFVRVTELLDQLIADRALRLGSTEDPERIELRVNPAFRDDPRLLEMARRLGLDAGAPSYTVRRAVTGGGTEIAMVTRSVMASLLYLSHGVRVPIHDVQAGRAGPVFAWTPYTGDIMDIRSDSARPRGAYTAVNYRGSWFYIDDSDLDSKSTFALVTHLLALQSGENRSQGPVLTLPIGG